MSQTYSQDDVQQILQRALTLKQNDSFSQTQLLEMAHEAGVSPELLHQAEQEWLMQRAEVQRTREKRSRRLAAFRAHLIPYLAVSTFLVLLNLATSPRCFWSVYPLLGWGLGVVMHGTSIYRKAEPSYPVALQIAGKFRDS